MDRDAATVRHTAISGGDLAVSLPPAPLSSSLRPFLAQNRMKLSRPGNESDAAGTERDGKRKREKSKVWWRKGKGRRR